MYEDFYGFGQSPFSLAPDPRFLYLSESHDDAIRDILQAIRRREGFIVLTGDIGTGKTTLCRALIGQLDAATFTSLVLDPFVSVEDLLKQMLLDFGVVSRDALRGGRLSAATKHELIATLHEFLLSLVPLKATSVLIIDEAQNISPPVLEQIRVLSNLETESVKLLQIVLVGQLGLVQALGESEVRQLNQRVSLRAVLTPLTRPGLEAYVAHRLSVADGGAVVFNGRALDRLYRYSGGVPRVINLLCDRSLMAGAQAGTTEITPAIVDRAARVLEIRPVKDLRRGRTFVLWLVVLLVLAALVAGVAWLLPAL
jgi:general secretion pathway protein A